MTESLVLDVLLILMLLGYLAYGFRTGLSRSAFVIVGVLAGVIAAFFLAPVISGWVSVPILRLGATLLVSVGLVVAGQTLGAAIGHRVRDGMRRTALSGIDRLLGGIVTGIIAALVASLVAFSVAQLGVPLLSRAIAGSTVLRTIESLTPDPVEAFLAQVRGVVTEQGIPLFTSALGGADPVIPEIDTGSAALNAAAQSVVRITGNAYVCGRSQSGTGFVVADDRVVTNAHVVAGVQEPVVEALDGEVLTGSIVYFDPIDDLAVISVPGLSAAPLPVAGPLEAGTDAAVAGYPYGGPFSSGAADVISVSVAFTSDIYDEAQVQRELYTLAADVREGNSGGPLLTLDGAVAGVVFARSGEAADVGYAMTLTELGPVIAQAGGLSGTVSSGDCIQD